jgi:ABC-2 type transport system permease protein
MIASKSFPSEASAFLGFFQRQIYIYRRFWRWELVWFIYALVSTLSIGYLSAGLKGQTNPAQLKQIQLYLLVGSLLWSYLSVTFSEVSFAITWEQWEGTIEYTFMAPVRRVTHLFGVIGFALVYGLARTALIVAVVVASFHLDLSNANLGAACLLFAASVVPLVGICLVIATFPLLSPEKGEQMAVATQGILLLVSGVYYPISVLPAPLQWVGDASPLTYSLASVRHALLDNSTVSSCLPIVALLAASGALLVGFGFWGFAWAERRAKRLGLLKRTG